jgi:hypothetical protein
MTEVQYSDFDVAMLWQAMCIKRESSGFTEKQMMDEISCVNNNHIPISLATVKNMVRRSTTTCQHALHMLRWLDQTPESFLVNSQESSQLPFSGEGRLYWNIHALAKAVSSEKEKQGIT